MTALADAESVIVALARRLAPLPRDIDDLAQVGRLAAWQAEAGFDGSGDRVAWMCAKARWAMIDHLRIHGPYSRCGRPRAILSLDVHTAEALSIPDPDPGPEAQVCDRESVTEFAGWLSGLPSRTAEAVVLTPTAWSARWGRDRSRASQIRGEALAGRAA